MTFQPQTFQPHGSDIRFNNSWLKSPGLKPSWLKSLGLKGPGLKLGVGKSGVEMSFKRLPHKGAAGYKFMDDPFILVGVHCSIAHAYLKPDRTATKARD